MQRHPEIGHHRGQFNCSSYRRDLYHSQQDEDSDTRMGLHPSKDGRHPCQNLLTRHGSYHRDHARKPIHVLLQDKLEFWRWRDHLQRKGVQAARCRRERLEM